MTTLPGVPATTHRLDRVEVHESTVCPKCLGLGAIVLMRRPLSPDATESCPSCGGRGLVTKRNGPADFLPASVGGRARP